MKSLAGCALLALLALPAAGVEPYPVKDGGSAAFLEILRRWLQRRQEKRQAPY